MVSKMRRQHGTATGGAGLAFQTERTRPRWMEAMSSGCTITFSCPDWADTFTNTLRSWWWGVSENLPD